MKPTVVALVLVAAASAATAFATPLAAQRPTPATPNILATSQTRIFHGDATRDDAPGVTKPVVVQSPQPQYTTEALRAKVHGSVDVQIVVGVDGSVARARVVKVEWTGEGYGTTPFTETTPGLVANALTAANAWKFKPGMLDGAPVPVLTTITLTFRIH
jgi:outer membrane biosynthesis protein TonB